MKTQAPFVLALASTLAVAATRADAQADFWTPTPGPEGGRIVGLARLSDGELLATGQSSGIFRSRDEGRTWQMANGNIARDYGSGGIWMGGVQVDAQDHVFVLSGWGLWRGTRAEESWNWTMLWSGPSGPSAVAFVARPTGIRTLCINWQGAIWSSEDQGDTWSTVPLPWVDPTQPEWGVGLAVAPDGTVWSATTRAVYRSFDGGAAWNRVALAADFEGPPWSWSPVNEFAGPVAVSSAGDVFVGLNFGDGTLRLRPDGSMRIVPTYEVAYAPTSFAFAADGTLCAGTYQNTGVIVSTDQGDTWRHLGTWNGLTGLGQHSVGAVLLLPDGTLLAGTAGDGIFRCNPSDPLPEWTTSRSGLLGSEVTAVAVAPDGAVFAVAAGAGLFRSENQGQTWQSLAPERWVSDTMGARDMVIDSQGTLYSVGHGLAVSQDRGLTWIDRWIGDPNPSDPGQTPAGTCLVIDARDRLVIGTGRGVYLTADGGLSWQASDLSLPIYSISLAPDPTTLTATTWGEGLGHGLYLSRNAGRNWTQVPFFAGYHLLGSAVGADGSLFAAPNAPLPGEWNPGLWRSRDGGNTWQKLPGFDLVAYGLSGASSFATPQLLFNPDNHLYAALGGSAVVRSPDNGETWETLDTGLASLPVRSVLDLTFDADGYAWAGTWGAGVFRSRESTAPFQLVEIELGGQGNPPRLHLHSNGQIKVHLYGSPEFDTTVVDLSTVRLAGAPILSTPSGQMLTTRRDLDRDGHPDLVLHFSVPALQLVAGDTRIALEGRLTTGRAFRGSTEVQVLP